MPKRRYVSENAIFSKSINKISVGAEATFYRLLSISDDFGVVPEDIEELSCMINYRDERERQLPTYLHELIEAKLFIRFEFDGKHFIMFRAETFDKYQSHIGNKRTQSEHTGIKAKTREEFDLQRKSKKIQENLRNVSLTDVTKAYSIKHKDESSFERGEGENFSSEGEKEYFETKKLFRELLYPDRTDLPNMAERQFSEIAQKYQLEKIRDALIKCGEENWHSVSSVKGILNGTQKTKAEKFLEQEKIKQNGKSSYEKRLNYNHEDTIRSGKEFAEKIKAFSDTGSE